MELSHTAALGHSQLSVSGERVIGRRQSNKVYIFIELAASMGSRSGVTALTSVTELDPRDFLKVGQRPANGINSLSK